MLRLIFTITLLLLTLTACTRSAGVGQSDVTNDQLDTPAKGETQPATPVLTNTPSPVAPTPTPDTLSRATPTAFKTMDDLLAEAGEIVPGFGGLFLDSKDNSIVYVYMLDPSQEEAAAKAAVSILGSEWFSRNIREVRVLQGEYRMADLTRWYNLMRDTVWSVPGLFSTDLDEGKNRIEIEMRPRRAAREEMEETLASLGIPREAVTIDVGCQASQQGIPVSQADEHLLQSLSFRVEVNPQVEVGELVPLKLTVENVSDQPVTLYLGGEPPHDFVLTTPEGTEVWHSLCKQIVLTVLGIKTLVPAEKLEFTAEWDQVYNNGDPVPPGAYLVRGVLEMDSPKKLVTAPQALEVLR